MIEGEDISGMRTRIRTAMAYFKCQTAAELAQKTDAELLRLPNFGRKSLNYLRKTEGTGSMMTDAEMTRLLHAIHEMALIGYPYPEGASNDPRLVWTLGQVAGVIARGMKAYQNNEPINIENPETKEPK